MYFFKNVPDVDHNKRVFNFGRLYLRSIESYRDRNTTIRILVSKSRFILNFVRLRNKQQLLWAFSELHVRRDAIVIRRKTSDSQISGILSPYGFKTLGNRFLMM